MDDNASEQVQQQAREYKSSVMEEYGLESRAAVEISWAEEGETFQAELTEVGQAERRAQQIEQEITSDIEFSPGGPTEFGSDPSITDEDVTEVTTDESGDPVVEFTDEEARQEFEEQQQREVIEETFSQEEGQVPENASERVQERIEQKAPDAQEVTSVEEVSGIDDAFRATIETEDGETVTQTVAFSQEAQETLAARQRGNAREQQEQLQEEFDRSMEQAGRNREATEGVREQQETAQSRDQQADVRRSVTDQLNQQQAYAAAQSIAEAGAIDEIESNLEDQTGAELTRDDIKVVETEDGFKGRLSREGQQEVAGQNAPGSQLPFVGGYVEGTTETIVGFDQTTNRVWNRNTPDLSVDVPTVPLPSKEQATTVAAAGVVAPEPVTSGSGALILGGIAAGTATAAAVKETGVLQGAPTASTSADEGELSIGEGPTSEITVPSTPTGEESELSVGDEPVTPTRVSLPESGLFGSEMDASDSVVTTELPLSGTGEGGTEPSTSGETVVPGDYPLPGRDLPSNPRREYTRRETPESVLSTTGAVQEEAREQVDETDDEEDDLGVPEDDPFRVSDRRLYDPSREFGEREDVASSVDSTTDESPSQEDIGEGIAGAGTGFEPAQGETVEENFQRYLEEQNQRLEEAQRPSWLGGDSALGSGLAGSVEAGIISEGLAQLDQAQQREVTLDGEMRGTQERSGIRPDEFLSPAMDEDVQQRERTQSRTVEDLDERQATRARSSAVEQEDTRQPTDVSETESTSEIEDLMEVSEVMEATETQTETQPDNVTENVYENQTITENTPGYGTPVTVGGGESPPRPRRPRRPSDRRGQQQQTPVPGTSVVSDLFSSGIPSPEELFVIGDREEEEENGTGATGMFTDSEDVFGSTWSESSGGSESVFGDDWMSDDVFGGTGSESGGVFSSGSVFEIDEDDVLGGEDSWY